MTAALPVRRLLAAAGADVRALLRRSFAAEEFAGWEVREADSFERARFLLQHQQSEFISNLGLAE